MTDTLTYQIGSVFFLAVLFTASILTRDLFPASIFKTVKSSVFGVSGMPTSFGFALVLALLLPLGLYAQRSPVAQPNRIAARLEPSHLVRISGNINPKARPENDRGLVSPNLNLDYITLHLKPTPAQQADLDHLLTQIQDPASPNYRKWLTPEQYADRFGSSPSDMSQIVAWLEGQGLTVISKARGRNFVVFKGTAGNVEAALHIEIHNFLVDGEIHYANTTEPSVPAAVQPFTIGFFGLDDFRPKPSPQTAKPVPAFTSQGVHGLAPGDLWVIYDTLPFYVAGLTGTGMKLAVIGQSDVNLSDMAAFQSLFGLPANSPVKLLVPGSRDPGILSGDSGESDTDLEVSGAMAPYAEILFVFSTNVGASVSYAVDQALAPVISYSYTNCELSVNSSGAAAYQQLARQGNAEGITWVAASGDDGAAGCEADGVTVATHGISVVLPASVPEVTGVGGTAISEGTGSYWAASNGLYGDSAVSYIPEVGWNDTGSVDNLEASGGGMSIYFSRPAWQSAPGVPSLNVRLVPDVAMSASPQHDPYITVQNGTPTLYGGTSAATPVFAGIVLLINQFFGANGLGNINPSLYALASTPVNVCYTALVTPQCVFHDITSGTNLVPCAAGTTGCKGGSLGYVAGPGYDMVTGLGSADAKNLALAAGQMVGPWISSVATANGGAAIAQNTFIVIKGVNLVPATTAATGVVWSSAPSFASGLMPTQIGGVGVTVNNKPAFVYFYCSAATDPSCFQDQLNILTPLDNTIGPVSIVVTSGGVSSPPFTANIQAVAPSFLLFNSAGYIAATHVNGTYVGPANLYAGYTTPARPGEEIVLYAVGFGLPSTALVNGSATQSGSLPVPPLCTVGGNPAPLAFAGLISPGLYQLNLTIPASAASGDNAVGCAYRGFTTPVGDLITVQ